MAESPPSDNSLGGAVAKRSRHEDLEHGIRYRQIEKEIRFIQGRLSKETDSTVLRNLRDNLERKERELSR